MPSCYFSAAGSVMSAPAASCRFLFACSMECDTLGAEQGFFNYLGLAAAARTASSASAAAGRFSSACKVNAIYEWLGAAVRVEVQGPLRRRWWRLPSAACRIQPLLVRLQHRP